MVLYFIAAGAVLAAAIAGYLKWKIAALALSAYIAKKGYEPPGDAEQKACTEYVIKKLLRLNAKLT